MAETQEWHKLKNKDTAEEQIVASLDGIDLDEWQAIPVQGNQAPSEFHDVQDNGVVAIDQVRKDQSDKIAHLKAMVPNDFYVYVLNLESRIAALEDKA